eukprot:TRINITY_DN22774_c0_g1_i1.p1 TRINITY_DN22774_c0_g1~~TRINITY_DN22774_c0_g1_i1.p1  ORF type:complete len:729 (+),score=200.43 TRINITY_DN22774_c0_g1_i1:37-2223(+)
MPATWYHKDGDSWVAFGAAYSRMIEARHSEGAEVHEFKIKGKDCKFNFKAMKQHVGGQVHKLRRIAESNDSEEESDDNTEEEVYQWEYRGDHGWVVMGDELGTKLDEAFGKEGKHRSYTWKRKGTAYVFNISKMTQLNESSGTKRKIRRVLKSEATTKSSAPHKSQKKNHASDDESQEDAPPVSKSTKKKKAGSKRPHSDSDSDSDIPKAKKAKSAKSDKKKSEKPKGNTTKLLKKGRGVVDPMSLKVDDCHVYEEGDDVYQCTLNQTNITTANNNKFYVIQLLESDKGKAWWLFTRWGRVGVPGNTQLKAQSSIEAAKSAFKSQFRSKTSNSWESRKDFKKVTGKYMLMDMELGENDKQSDDDGDDSDAMSLDAKIPDSKLPLRVRKVMELISDKKAMVQTLKELEIDTEQMPLGKISKGQIKKAFGYLKKIEAELKKDKKNRTKTVLDEANNMFFTLVPHNVGMCKITMITDIPTVKEKMELLDTLSDLEIADKILKQVKQSKVHPLDAAYEGMNLKMRPLPKDSEDWKNVEEYVANTHGKTHTAYVLELQDVFEIIREGEEQRYQPFKKSDNRVMLWHGSRMSNWMGILSQGLRIAPPEAPVTGYMFGKGVYFADVATKSGNYCHTSKQNNVGLMTINEVAMGKIHKLTSAKYMDKPPKGYDSTMGVGKSEPKGRIPDADGTLWPRAKMGDSGVGKSDLLYNEYIVYNVSQIKTRFLVKLKFNYK